MKPARSPRFQSAAERTSIAAISACGSPSGTFGAEHAATARTRYHARYMEPLFGKKLDWNAPRERPSEMALAIRTALPRWSTRCASGDVSWPPASSSCRPSSPWPWAAISWPSSAPWAVRASAASSSSSAPAPPSSALAAGRERKEVDTSAPSCRGRSSCSPRNRLARASDLSFAGCAWAWPIAYPASLSPQVTMQEEIGKHTSELQSQSNLVCRLLLEKKKRSTDPDQTPQQQVQLEVVWRLLPGKRRKSLSACDD